MRFLGQWSLILSVVILSIGPLSGNVLKFSWPGELNITPINLWVAIDQQLGGSRRLARNYNLLLSFQPDTLY
jgi:hypothetical protein